MATCNYEKGPQTLTDTISEVEKLNATQQLMVMIIPSSAVNMMSNEEDCCFQCQEPGHIAQHCPHIRCYECNEYGHIFMDCPCKIPPSRTPATHHKAHKGHHARWSARYHLENQERWNQSSSQSYYQRHCSWIHPDSHRGHSRSQHQDRYYHHRSSSWGSHSAHRGCSHRPHHDTLHQHHRSSMHHSSLGYQSWDCSRSHSWPSYQSSRHESCRSDSFFSSTRRRLNHKKNMIIIPVTWQRNQILNLVEPSPHSDSHEQGGLPSSDQVTVTLIMDYPTVMVHAGKCYKDHIDSGVAISLIRYSTYQTIDSSFKMPLQATMTKFNTGDGSPMTAWRMMALQLRITDFKFAHNFTICGQLPDMEIIFGIHTQKKNPCHMPGIRKRTVTYRRMVDFSPTPEFVNRRQLLGLSSQLSKCHQDTMASFQSRSKDIQLKDI